MVHDGGDDSYDNENDDNVDDEWYVKRVLEW